MKKLLMVATLASVSGLLPGMVTAQEIGKVLSSTPVLKRVTEPQSSCTNDADGRQRCTTQMVTEDRQIGYKVVYEYAGRQHTVQLPFPPGPTIELDVVPTAQGALQSGQPQPTYSSPNPVYSGEPPVIVERVVREPVYVDPPYYPARYYYPGYAYDPLYPIVGLALGYTIGSWSRPWGGHWRGHWSGGPRIGGRFRR